MSTTTGVMTRDEVRRRVLEQIAELEATELVELGGGEGALTAEVAYQAILEDSLSVVELIMQLEEALEVAIPDDETTGETFPQTVPGLVDFAVGLLEGTPALPQRRVSGRAVRAGARSGACRRGRARRPRPSRRASPDPTAPGPSA